MLCPHAHWPMQLMSFWVVLTLLHLGNVKASSIPLFELAKPNPNVTVPPRPLHCHYPDLVNEPSKVFACRYKMLTTPAKPTLTLLYYTANVKWLPFVANQLVSLQRVNVCAAAPRVFGHPVGPLYLLTGVDKFYIISNGGLV